VVVLPAVGAAAAEAAEAYNDMVPRRRKRVKMGSPQKLPHSPRRLEPLQLQLQPSRQPLPWPASETLEHEAEPEQD